MSSRFHNKWHRKDHHTYPTAGISDSGRDPIASPEEPFLGDFVLNGTLSAIAPLSASAGYFYSENIGVKAEGGLHGIDASGIFGILASTTSTVTGGFFVQESAGVYAFGPAYFGTGLTPAVDSVADYWPKAMIVNGYAHFMWQMFAPTIGAYDIQVNNLYATDLITSAKTISAQTGYFDNIYTTLHTTMTATDTVVSSIATPLLSAVNGTINNLIYNAHGASAIRNTISSQVPVNSWTLMPLNSATWNPYSYYNALSGTIKPTIQGLYECEVNVVAHTLSGTPLSMLLGVTTNTDMNNMSNDPDANLFNGSTFTNNGMGYTTLMSGVTGVIFRGTTFIEVDGSAEHIGIYLYSGAGPAYLDYSRLRVIYRGAII